MHGRWIDGLSAAMLAGDTPGTTFASRVSAVIVGVALGVRDDQRCDSSAGAGEVSG